MEEKGIGPLATNAVSDLRQVKRLYITLVYAVIVLFGAGTIFFLDQALSARWREAYRHEETCVAMQLKGAIRLAMEGKIAAMTAISGWFQHSEQTSAEKLDRFVALATEAEPSFLFAMHVDDKLIIQGCTPARPDLNLIGFDLKDNPYHHAIAREAETQRTAILSRPQTLPHGRPCFFVLAPIFIGRDFGGLVVGVFDQEKTVQEIAPRELTRAFDVSIRDSVGNQIFGEPDENLAQKMHEPIAFHHSKSTWSFAISPKRKPSHQAIYYRLAVWSLGLLLLAILVAFVHAMYHRRVVLEHLVAERTAELQSAYHTLEKVAITDPLTELFNRRFFYQRFGEELSRSKRNQMPLTCLILDLDNFKLVNDRHGHLLGDQILVETANILRRNTRKEDVAARYGGEEFVLLLVGADKERGKAVAERIRKDIEVKWFDRFANDPTPLRLTASIGITEFHPDGKASPATDDLIHQADTALYTAKRSGKNRVVVF